MKNKDNLQNLVVAIDTDITGIENLLTSVKETQKQLKQEIDKMGSTQIDNGKLKAITDPELLKKLKTAFKEKKTMPEKLKIIEDLYGNNYPDMELHDWVKLIKDTEWNEKVEYKLASNEDESKKFDNAHYDVDGHPVYIHSDFDRILYMTWSLHNSIKGDIYDFFEDKLGIRIEGYRTIDDKYENLIKNPEDKIIEEIEDRQFYSDNINELENQDPKERCTLNNEDLSKRTNNEDIRYKIMYIEKPFGKKLNSNDVFEDTLDENYNYENVDIYRETYMNKVTKVIIPAEIYDPNYLKAIAKYEHAETFLYLVPDDIYTAPTPENIAELYIDLIKRLHDGGNFYFTWENSSKKVTFYHNDDGIEVRRIKDASDFYGTVYYRDFDGLNPLMVVKEDELLNLTDEQLTKKRELYDQYQDQRKDVLRSLPMINITWEQAHYMADMAFAMYMLEQEGIRTMYQDCYRSENGVCSPRLVFIPENMNNKIKSSMFFPAINDEDSMITNFAKIREIPKDEVKITECNKIYHSIGDRFGFYIDDIGEGYEPYLLTHEKTKNK